MQVIICGGDRSSIDQLEEACHYDDDSRVISAINL